MEEKDIAYQWVRRCAMRLHVRHSVPPPEATELAAEMLACAGLSSCPERLADESLGMPSGA